MTGIVSVFLFVLVGALGFASGIGIGTGIEEARSHPRYLMTGGGLVFLLGLALGAAVATHPAAYYAVVFVMMLGIGAAASGWDAEQAWDAERADVRRERMRSLREQMLTRPVDKPVWERPPEPEHAESAGDSREDS